MKSTCSYCGSNNITSGIRVSQLATSKKIGLQYDAGFLLGTERMYADLCSDCGTVVRFFVKKFDHKWNTDE